MKERCHIALSKYTTFRGPVEYFCGEITLLFMNFLSVFVKRLFTFQFDKLLERDKKNASAIKSFFENMTNYQ